MPNRPDDPYARFPVPAAIGLALMLTGGIALLFLSATWQDWRQAALGALLLFALIGAALLLRRLKLPQFPVRRPRGGALPQLAEPPVTDAFDPAGFVEAVQRRHRTPAPRQIEERRETATAEAPRRSVDPSGTIRRLQDLRDHPATPEAERQAAGEKVKKLRTKRRSAWRKRP